MRRLVDGFRTAVQAGLMPYWDVDPDEVEYVNVNGGPIPDVVFIDEDEDDDQNDDDDDDVDYQDDPLPTVDYIDLGDSNEDANDSNDANDESDEDEATTKIPISVLDPSRFDIDKISSSTLAPTPTTTEIPDPTARVDPGLLE